MTDNCNVCVHIVQFWSVNKKNKKNVYMITKEEMHADQAEFRLLVLISKYARDP